MQHLKNITCGIIKPDAMKDQHVGEILYMIEKKKFNIKALEILHLTYEQAAYFYNVHVKQPFFEELCKYMSSGEILAIFLEKVDAVKDFRKLIGATNPAKAEEGTIRKKFGKSVENNAIHGSDSQENAEREVSFFFGGISLFK